MNNDNKIKFEVRRESKIRKEVSNKVFIPLINAIKEKGFELKDFLDGVSYDESYFSNKRERVEWVVFCKICTNMRPFFSPSDFEKIGSDYVKGGSDIEGLLAFLLFSSKKFSKLFGGKILSRITSSFLCLKMQIEFIGNNKIRFTLQMDEGYEHLPEFAYGNIGTIKELGNQAGLRDCRVDFKFIPQGALYDLTYKKSGLLFGIKKEIRWLVNINKAFWELTDSQEELLKEYEKLEDYKNNLELKVEERTSELKKAHDQLSETITLLQETQLLQNNFFTNISHEFRTPLTMILGPVKQIIENTNENKTRDELKAVHRNAVKLLKLVNQLLDISKIESGNMKLQTNPQNIIPLVKALLQSFCSYAERKRITLKFISIEEEIIAYIDKDKIEKIITNLLSNAMKFTPEGGEVAVTVSYAELVSASFTKREIPKQARLPDGQVRNDTIVEISVRDTGIGIPKKKLPKVFDRFYQVDGSVTREQEGTGIGLSLTKELVELHKGKIEVESDEGKGTAFIIGIPLGKEHLKPEEICEGSLSQIPTSQDFSEEMIYQEDTKKEKPDLSLTTETDLPAGKAGKPFLLIVEDNSDVRNYIKSNLDKDYRILEGVDGEDGWNKSIDQIPDLIISDVMMPKMDGFKLCDKLKTDERTSHIPVILLTAKASSVDKIEGFETGADDYIMKPFEPEELKVRIKNLIEQRKRIHEHFKKEGLFELDKSKITSIDKKFLNKALEIINQNISDSLFGVEKFAENLAVSRSLLYKKIVALTGEPPRELIKRIRLIKSAKLIEQKFGNLSEISLEVGFENPAYFSECFKKQFGVAPSQYHK